MADFILQKVATRQLPYRLGELDRKPSVLMKMDIEGSELEVLTDLVATGSLQHIDMTMVEYHPSSYKQNDSRADYIIGLKKSVETFLVSLKVWTFPLQTPRLFNLNFFIKREERNKRVDPLSDKLMQGTVLF